MLALHEYCQKFVIYVFTILLFLSGSLALADTPGEWYKKGVEHYEKHKLKEAHTWFLKAAEVGHSEAQFRLGLLYKNGDGVEKNSVEASRWYQKAAEQGFAKAQVNLGLMYQRGEGVEKNYSKAAEWQRKAANNGYSEGLLNLGNMYANGVGFKESYTEAYKLYLKAAKQGKCRRPKQLRYLIHHWQRCTKRLQRSS